MFKMIAPLNKDNAVIYVESYFNKCEYPSEIEIKAIWPHREKNFPPAIDVEFTLDAATHVFTIWVEHGKEGSFLYGEW